MPRAPRAPRVPSAAAALKPFHPIVRTWFRERLGAPSDPQRQGWPAIASGAHTLVLAPTGTGKTLAAFLWELNALIVEGLAGALPNAVRILYVSPLKALGNDVQRNLEAPLAELRERFAAAGERFPDIRVAVRTGDTSQAARARMIRKTPHVLITTPESLHIVLTSHRARTMLSGVRAVILDEIHAVAGTKRGAHLALALERLSLLTERPPQRIGLSATQRPLDEVARFLGGVDAGEVAGGGARNATAEAEGAGTRPNITADGALSDIAPGEAPSDIQAAGAPPDIQSTGEVRSGRHRASAARGDSLQGGPPSGNDGAAASPARKRGAASRGESARPGFAPPLGSAGYGRAPAGAGAAAADALGHVAGLVEGRAEAAGGPIAFRPVTVVDCGSVKTIEVAVQSPVEDLAHVGGTVWPAVADLVLRHLRGRGDPNVPPDAAPAAPRTTLVFVNNRAQAERIAARVNALAGEEVAQPYHGSLARERRFHLEERLKAGELRALVTTSSLELGIDVGSVDLVLQLQSPKRVSAALQRIGRAGHTLGAVSRGVLVPTFRDDAMEMAAIVGAMRAGDVEPTRVVQNALDVLAQTIVAAASVDDWHADDLYALVRRAYPYHALPRSAYDETLAMLAGKYPSDVASELEARVTWDAVTGRVTSTGAARFAALVSGGTIPDRGLYTVNLPDRSRLGELDEEFVHESRVGDVFQLGSTTWRIQAIEHDRVVVHPAPGAPARMPFWHGEFMSRSVALSARVGALRRALGEAVTLERLRAVADAHGCDLATAQSLAEYVQQQRAATGVVPDERTIVIEHFRDETGAVRIVMHAPFGGRVTAPWGMAIAQRVREALGTRSASGALDVQVQTSDDGVMLRIPDIGGAVPISALRGLGAAEAERRVVDELASTSLFGAQFRMNAARALLLPRGNPRRRMPLWLQRLKALDLLQAVKGFPSFPILVETYREVLRDAFDVAALREVLDGIEAGAIRVHVTQTELPSPFAASLMFGFVIDWLYGDDTPRAERAAAMLSLDRGMLDELLGGEGADEHTMAAIGQVVDERRGTAAGRRARTADELAHLLDRAGDLSEAELRARVATEEDGMRPSPQGLEPVEALLESGRAVAIAIGGSTGSPRLQDGAEMGGGRHRSIAARGESSPGAPPYGQSTTDPATGRHHPDAWRIVLLENLPRYVAAVHRRAAFATVRAGAALVERPAAEVVPAALLAPAVTTGVARREVLSRFLSLAGPVTVREILARYPWLPSRWVEERLAEWEQSDRLVRGRFRPEVLEAEWCVRRIVEAARRRALAALRKSIEAVELKAYAAFLHRWQHVDPRDRLQGAEGTAAALRQLYGLARPPAEWERAYLPARLERYDPSWLSGLGASGELVWAGVGRRASETDPLTLAHVRFFERGTGRVWLDVPAEADAGGGRPNAKDSASAVRHSAALYPHIDIKSADIHIGENARRLLGALVRHGASFFPDLQAATDLGGVALREAVRELVAAGLATNDTMDALREVIRARPVTPQGAGPDPSRWLPADFTPNPNRPVVQRRPNLRRLPKWKRPDLPGGATGWVGRWSVLATPGTLGPELDEEERAEAIARQWLERYGVVSRDWWPRERPPLPWRAIYRELRRLELRGEVRRGYFVRGLSGAQFALPEAVERLRGAASGDEDAGAPFVVLSTGDPANPYPIARAVDGEALDPLARPRGAGALLVCRAGAIAMAVEGRGQRVQVAATLSDADVTDAARALAEHLLASPRSTRKSRDVLVRTIDGAHAGASRHAEAFARAGYRRTGMELTYYGAL